jgi:hypothetical protein
MKKRFFQIALILIIGFSSKVKGQETIVKGTVHNWTTDTVYICVLPFHSPYSYSLDYQIIDADSTFNFRFTDMDKPFVLYISPYKEEVDDKIKKLLTNNLTDQHYWGHCIKIYTYGGTTYLIEPKTTLDIDLTYNSWIEQLSPERAERMKKLGIKVSDDNTCINVGKTKIEFAGSEHFKNSYYQKSFNLDDKSDKALMKMSSKNIHMAIINLENTKQGLLADLESNREKLSPVFYNYIKAEIEFGAKKEFLKYLRYEKEDYLKDIITTGEIPEKFFEIIAFDRYSINDAVLISEEYNEYLEFYLNFIMNVVNKEYVLYNPFSMEKLRFAAEELPDASLYYYLGNQFLYVDVTDEYKEICQWMIAQYPNGELNDKLKEKYEIE